MTQRTPSSIISEKLAEIERIENELKLSENKPKKRLQSLDKYVIFSITSMIVYTIISLLILLLTGNTADTLTACFFGFFGGEITICALIKIFKLKEDGKKKKEENKSAMG